MSLENQILEVKRKIDLLEKYALDGEIQPHEAYVMIKEAGIDLHFADIVKRVKDVAIKGLIDNFIEYGKQSYKDENYAYTVRKGGTRYYFTEIQEYKDASASLKKSTPYLNVKAVEQKYKTAFLMAQKGQTIVDDETGEIVDPAGVNVVYNPDTLSIKKR